MKSIAFFLVAALVTGTAEALDWQPRKFLRGVFGGSAVVARTEPAATPAIPPSVHQQPEPLPGVYRVTGYGAPPPDAASPAHGRLMAVAAARLDAMSKLAAAAYGTKLSSRSAADIGREMNYRVSERVQARMQGVRVLETRCNPDGTAAVDLELVVDGAPHSGAASLDAYQIRQNNYDDDGSPYEPADSLPAEMEVAAAKALVRGLSLFKPDTRTSEAKSAEVPDLPGENATPEPAPKNTDAPETESQAPNENPAPASGDGEDLMHIALAPPEPLRAPSEVRVGDSPTVVEKQNFDLEETDVTLDGGYTDLILDARGLGLSPSPQAEVLLPSGNRIYPFQGGLLEEYAPVREPVKMFVKTEAEARSLPGIGENPLVIRVDNVTGADREDLVISRSSARKLKALRDSRLLKGQGYVVIVAD